MNKLALAVAAAAVLFAGPGSAQSFGKLEVGQTCSYFGDALHGSVTTFGSVNEAVEVIRRIVKASGLAPRFEIEAADVPNAAAVVHEGKRYVLYNPNFMEEMRKLTGNDWSAISIMAHEVGHHLNGHTLGKGGSRPDIELEADLFSGYVLQRMGAELSDALAVMEKYGDPIGSITHPAQRSRLAAITTGWKQACDADPGCAPGQAAPVVAKATPTEPPRQQCASGEGQYRVTGVAADDVLNIRSAPTGNAPRMGAIPPRSYGIHAFECRKVPGYSMDWCRVEWNCTQGWVYSRYIERTPSTTSYRIVGVDGWDVLNMRSGPGTGSRIVAEIPPDGTGIELHSCAAHASTGAEWCEVTWRGIRGWASARFLASEGTGTRP